MTGYSRSMLAALFQRPVSSLATTEPVNFRGDLTDEARKALFNAALIDHEIERAADADADRVQKLTDAAIAERNIAEACLHLLGLHESHQVN